MDNLQILAQSVIQWGALTLLFLVIALTSVGCNEHRFTPLAEIEVYPDVIDYEVQRTDQYKLHFLSLRPGDYLGHPGIVAIDQ